MRIRLRALSKGDHVANPASLELCQSPITFDVFIGLATLLLAVNMMRDPRFGKIVGWAGVLASVVMLFGANIYYLPDPPYAHGFPHVGIFTGLQYLVVVLMLVRSLRRSSVSSTSSLDQ